MKITCNREKLLHAFQTVAAIAPARSPKPMLQNVKLEVSGTAATLMATDLEVGIRYDVTGIEVDAPGAAAAPRRPLRIDPPRKQRRNVPHRIR